MNSRSHNSEEQGAENLRSGFIALVGPANAGKSTLLNALVGRKVSIVSPKEQTTRNRILGIKTTPEAQFVFLDTPGFLARRYRGELARYLNKVVSAAAEDVDVLLMVIDGARLLKDQDVSLRIRAAVDERKLPRLSVVAINKIDAFEQRQLLPMIAQLNEVFAGWTGPDGAPIEFLPISAKSGEGLEELERVIKDKLPLGPQYFPEQMVTDQPEPFLAAEIVREKLMLHLKEELPYHVAVQVERWQFEKDILHISAAVIVDKESQKGIVIGKGGSMLKNVGQEARLDLERVLGTRIFLELFVRVEEKWTMSARGLARAGYRPDLPYSE